jgi:hypothetical protein
MNPIDEYPRFKINQLSSNNNNVQILIMTKNFWKKNFLGRHASFDEEEKSLVLTFNESHMHRSFLRSLINIPRTI